ncbi:NADH dehydrogenase [Nitrosospira sp. Nsp5]|uniref:NADH:ubiquinone reductase (non-electrogenic) n=1 Tax=Nitrosospira multiformis TaxID=1231 RepID=A0ABY0TG99_9PROT|nr:MULTISPECIES: NAD(P)/FAD-dependent oxidoreductase [Nitrosospira]PTR10650.1 NADH dehydrogenase [Nitrosospira sp. Nsp5]SDQ78670.1 NADH dehydrogenase [Nitrosospira multiformis]
MKREIVVVGGGFAGINLVKHLANETGFHVTLVDMNNYNFFSPLLYQVATGFLDVSNICYPFRKLFHDKKNISFRLGSLQKVVPEENKVLLSTGELFYDYLVLATGTESNYFGMENIRKAALPMKTMDDAIEIRNYVLQKMEEATIATDEAKKRKLTTVVVAGGGPTGVEIAGMLAEMRKNILQKDYPELAGHKAHIYLVDGAPALLTSMSGQSQRYTYDTLMKMRVKVRLNTQVMDYINDAVILANGEAIQTRILFWTAGVIARVFEGMPLESYGRGNRLSADEYNKVAGTRNIYAIGDTCLLASDESFPQGHPQLAQVALQQGKNLADNFIASLHGKPLKPFIYHDKGSLAIIGRSKAVADLPKPEIHFNGFMAWVTWLFVHLFSLITYRNRLMTMTNWMVAFLTKDQSLRMIVRARPVRKK